MPGARCTRGLMCKIVRRNAHEHTGSAEALRHSPRNGFTAYAVLSPASEFVLSPSSRGLMACYGPVEPDMPPRTWRQQRASGPHGFAVRDSVVRPAHRLLAHGNRPANKLARP